LIGVASQTLNLLHIFKKSVQLYSLTFRGIQRIYAKTLDPAENPRGVGKDVIKRQARLLAWCNLP
jgi:hypothetical protein